MRLCICITTRDFIPWYISESIPVYDTTCDVFVVDVLVFVCQARVFVVHLSKRLSNRICTSNCYLPCVCVDISNNICVFILSDCVLSSMCAYIVYMCRIFIVYIL